MPRFGAYLGHGSSGLSLSLYMYIYIFLSLALSLSVYVCVCHTLMHSFSCLRLSRSCASPLVCLFLTYYFDTFTQDPAPTGEGQQTEVKIMFVWLH